MELHIIDYISIFLYTILTLYVGVRFKKKINNNTFLIADRNLSFFASCMTISASKVGAGLLVTYSALVFAYGFSALWLFGGYVFGYFIFYFFASKLKIEADKYNYYTLADYFRKKFGSTTAYLISILVFLSMFGWILTNLIGGGKIIALISGFSFPTAVIFMGIIIIVYLVAGGFSSVVKTDIMQYLSIIVIFLFLLIVISTGGLSNYSTSTIKKIEMGKIIIFFLTGFLFPLGSAELWQRVYATKSIKDIKMSLVTASILYFVFGFILSLICLRISGLTIDTSSETALIEGMGVLLPVGFAGILVVAFFAAIMSSADTFIFTSSSTFVQDYLQKLFNLNNDSVVKLIKIFILIFGTLGIILAILLKSIIDVTFLFTALTLSIGIISLASWIRSKISPFSINLAIMANILTTLIVLFTFGINMKIIIFSILSTLIFLFIGEIISIVKGRRTSHNIA